ncbi:MAG TPA: nickel pincer cofactor biosynthesis protein LarC [Anaerolineae bacterium]
MKIAYFDLVAGASGDMILGALVDAGLPFVELEAALANLRLPGFSLKQGRVQRGAFSATKIDVVVEERPPARHWHEIRDLIAAGDLPAGVRERALRIFRRMIEVEAGIHNLSPDEVHLHEMGAVDTIVDVTGALLGLDLLGVGRVESSPVPLGRGVLHGSHGRMPLPAPAALALLKGALIVGVSHDLETVTPTAAALLGELAADYGPIPAMRLAAIGYGAGSREEPAPNLLRVLIGEAVEAGGESDVVDLLETNIDDMNPEIYGYLFERTLAAGALDVFLAPVIMKKNRPGVVLSVLCRPQDTAALRALLFAETSTLGIRSQRLARHTLHRHSETVDTSYGPVRIKVCGWGEDEHKAAPEYEDCANAARTHGVPLREVYEAATTAWRTHSEHHHPHA